MRRRLLFALAFTCALVFALVIPPHLASADEASGKQHFKTGVDLYDKQDFERALTEFRAAYAELHLYVIKRNIALTLRELHRYAPAIESLEEYLAEGGDKIDGPLREAAEATITDMSAHVGTVRVTVDAHRPPGTPPPPFALTVDDEPVAREKAALPVTLDAGVEHVLRAHADGFADGVSQVTVTPGQRDVPVSLELVPITVTGIGTLRVHANVPTAVIRVDDGAAQEGAWSGELRAGPHRVVVLAPGYAKATADITLSTNAILDLPITMIVAPMLPPTTRFDEGRLPLLPRLQRPRPWYGVAGLALQGETPLVGAGLDGPASGLRQTFGGASLVLKLGRMLSRETNAHFALEGVVELGYLKASYPNLAPAQGTDADVGVFNWVIAPELVYRSGGKLQLLVGAGVGIEGEVIDGTFIENGSTVDKKSSGVGATGLAEVGGELRLRRAFVQLSLFGDVHGESSLSASGDGDFLNAAGWRGGVRLMVGTPFF